MYTVTTLGQTTLRDFLRSSPGVVLRVTRGETPRFPPTLIDYLDREYPGAFRYGTLPREAVQVESWWDKHFRRGEEAAPTPGSPGYYLFVDGQLEDHAPAPAPPSKPATGLAALFLRSTPRGHHEAEARRLAELGEAVASTLEASIQHRPELRLRLAAASSRGSADRRRREEELRRNLGGRRDVPPPLRRPAEPDPYAVLGVPRSAGREEIDKVFRIQAPAWHTDRYVGLSPETRRHAEEQFKRLSAARERIYRSRGWR